MPPLQVAPHAGGAKRGGHDGVHVGEPPFPHVATGEIAFLQLPPASRRAQPARAGSPAWRRSRACARSWPAPPPKEPWWPGPSSVSRSSARPHASFAATLAVQGAMTKASHSCASDTWWMGSPGSSNRPTATGSWVSARKVVGPTNSRRMLGHDHLRAHARLLQATHHLARLVGGDAACHAHQHARALRPCRLAGRGRRLLALPDALGQSAGRFRRPVQARPLVHATPFPSSGRTHVGEHLHVGAAAVEARHVHEVPLARRAALPRAGTRRSRTASAPCSTS